MDFAGRASPGVLPLHVDVTQVCRGFVGRDVRGKTDDLTTKPKGSEVIAFDEAPGLVRYIIFASMKENLDETYGVTLWSNLYQRHGDIG